MRFMEHLEEDIRDIKLAIFGLAALVATGITVLVALILYYK